MQIAYKKFKNNTSIQLKTSGDILTNHHHYIFSNFLKINEEEKLKELIKIDTDFKEFCLNRVLFLEQAVKQVIIGSCLELNISDTEVYNLFEQEEEFKLFSIRQSLKAVNTCEVIKAPLGIFLDNITIDELSKVLNCLWSSVQKSMCFGKTPIFRTLIMSVNRTVKRFSYYEW